MAFLLLRRVLPAALAAYILFIFGLSRVGVLGPDEPRYAAIGREMAWTGDFITPRLWGEPWFEKPALLYWLIAGGFRAGLDDDLAPRLPVALLSLAFLVFFYLRLRGWLDETRAWLAAMILGTSAGWVAISQVGITDIPLAVFFSAAMLCGLELLEAGGSLPGRSVAVGALLGLAVLSKGLVPLALGIPFFVWIVWRRRWLDVLVIAMSALVVAGPWYTLCYLRNGWAFIDEFFVKHHFGRFSSAALQHVQPWWYYVPVLLGLMFPWGPLLVHVSQAGRDVRLRLFFLWFAWGFVFFSLSTNKLPAYLLPLLPALAVVLASSKPSRWVIALCGLTFAILPVVSEVLPPALVMGLSRVSIPHVLPVWIVGFVLAISALAFVLPREPALKIIGVAAVFGVVYLKLAMYPRLDPAASARPLWRALAPHRQQVCVEDIHRAWLYGLNYYAIAPLPACENGNYPIRLVPGEGGRPVVARPVEARKFPSGPQIW